MDKKRFSGLLAILLTLLFPLDLCAQKEQRDPLTAAQAEEIREAAVVPALRVQLYVKFLNQHAETLRALARRAKTTARAQRIRDEILDFTALMDELASNLDQYGERKADLRQGLKSLNESSSHWSEALLAIPAEPIFDIARKESLESLHDLAEQSSTLAKEQEEYFRVHKDLKDQQRAEPRE
jgi:hypothetical protein